jgi:methyl-accepting chemotaxis protein
MLILGFTRFTSVRAKIILLALLGVFGVASVSAVNGYLSRLTKGNLQISKKSQNVATATLQARMIQEKYVNNRSKEVLSVYEGIRADLEAAISDLQASAAEGDLARQADKIAATEKDSAKVFESITQNLSEMHSKREEIRTKIEEVRRLLGEIVKAIDKEDVGLAMQGDTLDVNKATVRNALKEYLSIWDQRLLNIQNLLIFSNADSYVQANKNTISELELKEKNFVVVLQSINSDQFKELWSKAKALLPQIDQTEAALFSHWKNNQDLMARLEEAGASVSNAALEINKSVTQRIERDSSTGYSLTLIILAAGTISLTIAGYLIIRVITKSLNRSIDSLSEIAGQVESGAKQLADASRNVAEGTSQQAAAIEETSSSIEEMSSMTKQNADNAIQVNHLMKEATSVVEGANTSMGLLTSSMQEICKASEDTEKIIKTIDEIAFQTNLLALNAAVEAARAGEAGAGFAVVADEVRNLAMRAAEAARNTADLIEGTVKKIKGGSDLVNGTNQEFRKVSDIVVKSGELVGEIAAASQEQAQGIEQINRAVSDMDKVTQQSSANAEESASASAEMRAHAEQMEGFVSSLVVLIGGKGKKEKNARPGLGARSEQRIEKLSLLAGPGNTPTHSSESLVRKTALPRANPRDGKLLEGENFEDF